MKHAILMRFVGGWITMVSVLLSASSAEALNGNWFSPSAGSWANAANWSLSHVPISSDQALIAWARTAQVDGVAPDVGDISYSSAAWGGTVEVNSGGSLRVLGNIAVQNYATDTNYFLKVQGGSLTVDGTLTMRFLSLTSGTLDMTDGALTAYGSFTFSGGTLKNATALSIAGATYGDLTQSGGTLERSSASGTTTVGAYALNGDAVALVSGGTLSITNGLSNLASPGQSSLRVEGGTLNLNSKAVTVGQLAYRSGTISNVGAAGVTLNGTGDALVLRNTTAGFKVNLTGATGGNVVFESDSNGTGVMSGALDLGGVTRTVNVADGSATEDLRMYGQISNGALIKSGSGTLVLSGTNIYSGLTTVSAGELLGGTGGSCNSPMLVADGATNGVKVLTYGGQWTCPGLTYSGNVAGLVIDLASLPASPSMAPLQINGDLTVTGSVAVVVRNGYWAFPGTYPLVSYSGTLNMAGAFTVGSLPAGVTATVVNNTGAKRLELSVMAIPAYTQPYSVWTNLVGGSAGGSWGTAANWSNGVPNATDAIADLGALDITVDSIVTNDGTRTVGTLRFGDTAGTSNWTLTNASLALATSVGLPIINVSNNTATVYTPLTGSQGLIKNGAGTLILGSVNTYSGGTVIEAGTLTMKASSAAIRGTVTVNSAGTLSVATPNYDGFGQTAGAKIDTLNIVGGTANNTVSTAFITDTTVNMTGGKLSGSQINWRNTVLNTLASSGSAMVSAPVLMRNDYAPGVPLTLNVADGSAVIDLLISDVISQVNAGASLVKNGSGTLALTGASTYTGPTTISQGVLQLGTNGTSGALSASSVITNNAVLAFKRANTITQGTQFSSAAICGTGSVVQAGSGTNIFNAANTFTGPVVVTNGMLRLANATALSATNDIYIVTSSGAKIDLPFTGTTIVRRLYVNGEVKTRGTLYGVNNLSAALSGTGSLLTTEGPAKKGMLIRVL